MIISSLRSAISHLIPLTAATFILAVPIALYSNHERTNSLEAANRPVVENMDIVANYNDSGHTYIRVFGDKVRDNCGPPLAISGSYGDNSFENITFMNDQDPETKKFAIPFAQPVKNQIDFGWWRLTPAVNSKTIVLTVFHDCEGTLVRTDMKMKLIQGENY